MNGTEYLTLRINHLSEEISQLGREAEFDAEDVWRYVRDAAAVLERFLQRCTLRCPPRDQTLCNLIDALALEGISLTVRQDLHAVRLVANAGKHDATRHLTTIEAAQLVAAAEAAVVSLAASRIPEFSAPYHAEYRRQYVIAVYDHFAHGETEFAVFLAAYSPKPSDRVGSGPLPIEVFECKYTAEETIRSSLDRLGRAVFEGAVDADTVHALGQDSEFAFAWLWEGGHQDLVAAFAPHQHSMDLIPGLLRGDNEQSILSSMVSAAVETARPCDWADLLLKAHADYGISRRGTVSRPLAEAVAELVARVPEGLVLRGPRWLDPTAFASVARSILARDERLGVAVLPDGTLAVRVATLSQGIAVRVLEDADLTRPDDPLPAASATS